MMVSSPEYPTLDNGVPKSSRDRFPCGRKRLQSEIARPISMIAGMIAESNKQFPMRTSHTVMDKKGFPIPDCVTDMYNTYYLFSLQ